jgi:2-methylisocitrate lyase-like PEP mutase family enzyme
MTKSPLAQRLQHGPAVLVAGVYDALTALIAEKAGFEAIYLSGGAVSYTLLGRSDVGLTTARETCEVLGRITDRVGTPIIVDADTGYGNALNVQRTVRTLESAGAAMIQLEDQTFPKRCGHLDGKTVIPAKEMCGKLKAALDARKSDKTLIMARTDAIAMEGFDAALARAEAYLECGVDALFIEAPATSEQLSKVCERFAARIPLLANMTEGGKTPMEDADRLGERGFRIVLFAGGAARFVAHGLQRYYASLRQHKTTAPMRGEMLDFTQLNQLIGTPELLEAGRKYET